MRVQQIIRITSWLVLFSSSFVIGQNDRTEELFAEAIVDFNLIASSEFSSLNCGSTINEQKMQRFFEEYPQFNEDVKVVFIANCYGAKDEKFYVLFYDAKKEFYVPKSIPDIYKDDPIWPTQDEKTKKIK